MKQQYIKFIENRVKHRGNTVFEAIEVLVIWTDDCLKIIKDLKYFHFKEKYSSIQEVAFNALLELCEEEGIF